ncbi:rRNA methyltransferase [Bombiscardovia apis]|uniref:rRNA methyltransferase n=1 Tax=Bombiscardovia apis TaxID=2932182 RepID=A0ABN6SJN2_9BIFI|nr:RNA methyltransferase [Bombiscardovia apis]BDR54880.1 rRNA methyltransferase [Bombiscardovia apis]
MPEYREIIDNPRSERIRRIAELSERRRRQRYGRFMIEGPQCVREAVACQPQCLLDIYVEVEPDAGMKPVSTAAAQIRNSALKAAPRAYIHYVSSRTMQAISKDAQGIVAVGRLEDLQVQANSLLLPQDQTGQAESVQVAALWQVRDPGNEGTIIRTADAAGLQALLLVDDCVDPFSPKVLRATAGSIFHIPVVQVSTDEFFTWVQTRQLPVVAADVYGTSDRVPVSLPDMLAQSKEAASGLALLFGNEARGLPTALLERSDSIVSIPIYGKAESLNLAMSAAVLLYSLAMSSRLGRM